MRLSIYPISAKPFHNGHYKMICKACKEADYGIIIISLSDRKRENEFPILGSQMAEIWKDHLTKIMPQNAKLVFVNKESPVRRAYEILGHAENTDYSDNVYNIFGDPEDISTRFGLEALEKYYPRLSARHMIQTTPCPREDIEDISGTRMREFLSNNDKESFAKYLPSDIDSEAIYSILNRNK